LDITDNPFREAVKQWGADFQIGMVAEEVGELLSALSKFKRGRIRPMDLASEIADVRIMLEQVAYIVAEMTAESVTADNFEAWVGESRRVKLERLCGLLGVKYEHSEISLKEQVNL
jgi:NTP pyrophosphatase (non-canonical NTP hydrolase)